MPEIELSKYCRQNGYYVEDVKEWRASCIAANELQKEDSKVPTKKNHATTFVADGPNQVWT